MDDLDKTALPKGSPARDTQAIRTTQPPHIPARLTRAQHWHKTRRLSAMLLLLWLLTGFCAAFFARELAGLSVFGWPLSFYLAAQGSSLVYLTILAVYAWRMRRLDLAASPDHLETRA
jgi:putative solute:sodium symporter small subunit